MINKLRSNTKGFTLIEVIVVVLIIGLLTAFTLPIFTGYITKTKVTMDKQTLNSLNKATTIYTVGNPTPNPFDNSNSNDSQLLQVLVDNGFFTKKPVPQQKDYSFKWSFINKVWTLSNETGPMNNDLTSTEVTMGTGGFLGSIISYLGTKYNITIPALLNGQKIFEIRQDAFNNKQLDSVAFPVNSNITRIHARAFKDNKLTEILLPASLNRIDFGAFLNNSNLTKVTIGPNVYLEANVFLNSDKFKTTYTANGAGTYIYNGTIWIKQ